MATNLGKAYIQIMPSAKGIKAEVEKVLGKEIPPATEQPGEQAGQQMGESMGTKLVGSLKKLIFAAGLGTAIKESLMAGADLQQSVGGVETIFKQSANIVSTYAKSAYSRAGVSANEYMEQVTSFSASLLQSLGGNTEKAARYADRAMVDMSDNANKFGTNIGDIQNAYQGFAKANYTMLDNLKLGYGGNQSEMKRLIADASKMTDVQKELGITVDESSMSFGNIVNAISVMQKSLDISGTTAKEAKTTFSGSLGSMKAAATDFLASLTGVTNGSGEAVLDVQKSLENLVNSAITFFAGNLVPMAVSVVVTLPKAIISALTTQLPLFVNQGTEMINNLGSGFQTSIPNLVKQGTDAVVKLSEVFFDSAGQFMQAGSGFAKNMLQGLMNSLPDILDGIFQILINIVDFIGQNGDLILNTSVEMMGIILEGIIQSLPNILIGIQNLAYSMCMALLNIDWIGLGVHVIEMLIDGVFSLIETIPSMYLSMGENAKNKLLETDWLQLGCDLIVRIFNGLLELEMYIPNKLKDIAEQGLIKFTGLDWKGLGSKVVHTIKAGAESAKRSIGGAFDRLGQWCKDKFGTNWVQVGGNIIQGIIQGITRGAGQLFTIMRNLAKNVLKTAKKALGIHSPSKAFDDEFGVQLPAGAARGVKRDKSLTKAIKDMAHEALDTAQVVLGDYGNEFVLGGDIKPYKGDTSNVDNSMTVNQTINSAKELSPAEIAEETEALLRRAKWA